MCVHAATGDGDGVANSGTSGGRLGQSESHRVRLQYIMEDHMGVVPPAPFCSAREYVPVPAANADGCSLR